MAKVTADGRELFLHFNGEALFSVRDAFGGAEQMLERIRQDTREGMADTYAAAALLAEQGELSRRAAGYDAEPITAAEWLSHAATPNDLLALKLAVMRAVELGFGREVVSENDEIDLGLQELGRKKKA